VKTGADSFTGVGAVDTLSTDGAVVVAVTVAVTVDVAVAADAADAVAVAVLETGSGGGAPLGGIRSSRATGAEGAAPAACSLFTNGSAEERCGVTPTTNAPSAGGVTIGGTCLDAEVDALDEGAVLTAGATLTIDAACADGGGGGGAGLEGTLGAEFNAVSKADSSSNHAVVLRRNDCWPASSLATAGEWEMSVTGAGAAFDVSDDGALL
jgi:hypothetical protein